MVSAGLSPREAVRRVEARLAAAGCPDADYDARELFRAASGRDARLSDRVLTTEEAEKLENLCTRREQREPLQYLCGIWSFLDFDLAVGPGVLCPRADTEVVAEAAANTLTGITAPRVLDLCAGTGCLGLGVKRFCPAAQVTCVEKSPEAFVYLEKNCRCALKGQGGQTEDLLEPAAFEQEAAPAFDWGPALNALRAKAKPAYAVEPVEGDLFTYWKSAPEGELPHRIQPALSHCRGNAAPAAGGGAGTGHGAGSGGGRPCVLPCPCTALPEAAEARRRTGAGDRLAAERSCDGTAGRKWLDGHCVPQGLWRQ